MGLPHLRSFVPEVETFLDLSGLRGRFKRADRSSMDSVLGWGLKPTAKKARRFAARNALAYLALEDGFLRSVGLGVQGVPPLSLVCDDTGIYYDGSRPSRVETLIQGDPFASHPGLKERAESAIKAFRGGGLSKYNCGQRQDLTRLGVPKGCRVLIVDQCLGDASVQLSLAGARQFSSMLAAARDDHPGARFLVKTHPDVLAGKRRGFLETAFSESDVTVVGQNIEPGCLFEQVDAVYTVSSLLGMEALIADHEVRCFGLPFYAGWGVTRDVSACPRRTRDASVLEIFAAAYILYPRYVDPYTGGHWSFEQAMDHILWLKREYDRRPQRAHCLGIPRWKRPHVLPVLQSPFHAPRFYTRVDQALDQAAQDRGELVVWAAQEPLGLEAKARARHLRLSRLEDGFVRSTGLGSDLIPAASLVLDRSGTHFNPARPSDLETLLEGHEFTAEELNQARKIRKLIQKHSISKYNSDQRNLGDPNWPRDRKRILVPGQVDDDAAVLQGTREIRSNRDLLRAVRLSEPEAFLIYKPHPDVVAGNRKSFLTRKEAENLADLVVRDVSVRSLFAKVDAVHVMTSLTGFEALVDNIEVSTYGGPFYAGWGLTRDRLSFPRRTRRLSLDALIAGALLLYPMYFDWSTRLPCDLETLIARFGTQKQKQGRQDTRPSKAWLKSRQRVFRRVINGTAGWFGFVRR